MDYDPSTAVKTSERKAQEENTSKHIALEITSCCWNLELQRLSSLIDVAEQKVRSTSRRRRAHKQQA
jgi:hypothetical protein